MMFQLPPLRRPQNLLSSPLNRVSLGLKSGLQSAEHAPQTPSGQDRLRTVFAKGKISQLLQLQANTPDPTESLSLAGLPVNIFWGQQFQQPSQGPRIPAGYAKIRGSLPKGLSQTASHILKRGNALGTYTPFTLNGKKYLALNEYHSHYAGRPHEPAGKIYAITVFQKS